MDGEDVGGVKIRRLKGRGTVSRGEVARGGDKVGGRGRVDKGGMVG